METAPRNCRFLSLVVVEVVLTVFSLKKWQHTAAVVKHYGSSAVASFWVVSQDYLWPEGRNPRVGTPSGGIRENGAS